MIKNKCGEIFYLDSHLEIICSFCLENFRHISIFCTHLLDQHLDIENKEFVNSFWEPNKIEVIDDKNNVSKKESTENLNVDVTSKSFKLSDCNVEPKELKRLACENLDSKDKINDDESESECSDECKLNSKEEISEDSGRPKIRLFTLKKAEILENFIEIDDGNYFCKICNRSARRYKLTQHLQSHDNSRYKHQCNICLKLFISESSLVLHHKNYHENEKPYKCSVKDCNKTFVEEKRLKTHLKYHGERPFKCFVCSKAFLFETKLKKHNLTHFKESKRRRPIVKQQSINVTDIKVESSQNFEDDEIEDKNAENLFNKKGIKELSSTRFKQTQMIRIEKPKPRVIKRNKSKVICDTCGKSISKYKLPQHIRTHDDSRYQFECEKCKKSFISDKSLQNHIKAIHTKELPFACNWVGCTKRFIDQSALKAHMVRHTSDRPFKCEVCSKGFIYETKRDYHYKIYHVNGRIFRCEICNKGFYEQHNLNKHKIIHSNERPYACDQCPAKFLRERCLQWHMKQHSGIKDFTCKICGKQYALYNGIYSHMKTHGIKYSLDYEKGLTDGKTNIKSEKE